MHPNVLSWLESVLAERFGHRFTLRNADEHHVRLQLPGDSHVIEIAVRPDVFVRTDSDLAFTTWNPELEGWQSALGRPLPAPGYASLPHRLVEPIANGLRLHYDVLGLTYWMLVRQEEVGRTDLDHHGRFPAEACHAFKHGYLDRPVVDEWLYLLGQLIGAQWPGLALAQHRFSQRVSHDVDSASSYGFMPLKRVVRGMAADILKRGNFRGAMQAPSIWMGTRTALQTKDPVNTFDWLMDISDHHGLVSAFYFICGRTRADKDAEYDPEHPAIRHLMQRIHARGHEIGLHPSFDTYRRPEALLAEAQRLRRVCEDEHIVQREWGGRMHYLRWDHPTTMRAWDGAGMTYDSTLGYAGRAGFRCGTCYEYPSFDPVEMRPLKLRIRPLIAMECTIISPEYMGLGTGRKALQEFGRLKDACRAVNGSFTMLWHNSRLGTDAEKTLYQAVLDHNNTKAGTPAQTASRRPAFA